MGNIFTNFTQTYRVVLDTKLYLASLVDLPAIIEAQKTLDFRTFYKSVDVSQLLYIHNKSIEDIQNKTPEEISEFAKKFNPITDDPDFLQLLFKRGETVRKYEQAKQKGEEFKMDNLKFR